MRKYRIVKTTFFLIAIVSLLLSTIPSENETGELAFLIISKFAAVALAAPYLLSTSHKPLPHWVLLYFVVIFIILIASNLAAPSNYAIGIIVLGAMSALLFALCGPQKRAVAIFDAILLIHLCALFIQLTAFYVLGEVIHPHQWLFPSSESRSREFLGFFRPGGLHVEPGTYSTWLYLTLVLRILFGGRLTDLICVVTFASFILTFSAWGIIAAFVGFAAIAMSTVSSARNRQASVLMGVVLTVTALGAPYANNIIEPLFQYMGIRLDQTAGSANLRAIAFDEFLRTYSDHIFLGLPFSETFCPSCESPQDLGVWSQIVIRFGLLTGFVTIIVSLVAAWRHSPAMLLLVGFSFSGKHDFNSPITWMILAAVLFPLYSRPSSRRLKVSLSR